MHITSPQHFYAHGKLLLTGEYVVLDGATALAIPTKLGQSMTVAPSTKKGCHWKSKDVNNEVWFEVQFGSEGGSIDCAEQQLPVAHTLLSILQSAQQLNPDFNPFKGGRQVETRLEFPRDWGLGSSSTLLYNIAQWANVDPVALLQKSFGGSGYDVAVAQHQQTLLYTLQQKIPEVNIVSLPWDFKDRLFFVHLNTKQDSKEGIVRYKNALQQAQAPIKEISSLTLQIANCEQFDPCMALFQEHENIISDLLGLPTVKNKLFPDFDGVVKSLGAWGGDFVLAGGGSKAHDYFRRKGYGTIVSFTEMVLDAQ